MRDPRRIPRILGMLRSLWEQYPDLRLGQILCNAADEEGRKLFYIEDQDLEEGLAHLFLTYQTLSTQEAQRRAV